MQNCISFDIERKAEIDKTFRVARILSDFDLKPEHSNERFTGKIELPKEWNIGVIVGASGTGKTTIAKELFSTDFFEPTYSAKSVIDDMPKTATVNDITKMFYTVGFGSSPSWLKPYKVLSNGEKMRVDLANALLSKDKIIFDEFTSVVDRRVAETMCIATNKAIKKTNKQFIAVSCHYDILEWLQPDWYFDTNQMKCFFGISHALKGLSKSGVVAEKNGTSLGNITI